SRVIFLGAVYLLLGIVALAFASATTLTAIITLGFVLMAAGIAEIIYGIQGRKRGQLWPHVAFGSLGLICGFLILINPIENTLGFTLVAGFLLIANGLAKTVGSLAERESGWNWYLANGIISIILGGLILRSFPISAFWTIGVFVGVDLLVVGASLMGLGYSAKKAKRELVGQAYSTLNPEPGSRSDVSREEHPFH
ncbi:MAG: HdeD family acid-resistance protein, partial [Pseudobdellovibrionaceae bacterium]